MRNNGSNTLEQYVFPNNWENYCWIKFSQGTLQILCMPHLARKYLKQLVELNNEFMLSWFGFGRT